MKDSLVFPPRFILGVCLASQREALRKEIQKYNLPKRVFLGPTSMDNELAALMVNVSRVRPGEIVWDPFSGTCSILIAATAAGCYCVGSDLDIKIIAGKETTYADAFRQYGLPYADLCWADINKSWIKPGCIDAVICDPPYNIRAGSRRASQEGKTHFGVGSEGQRSGAMYTTVLDAAATALRTGGRLVMWVPVPASIEFAEKDFPKCDGMQLECWGMQQLAARYGRRLVCYVKQKAECGTAHLDAQHCIFDDMRTVVGIDP